MNTELLARVKEWIEFQQRSCVDGRYPVSLIANDLKVPVDEIRDAIKDDKDVLYQVKD